MKLSEKWSAGIQQHADARLTVAKDDVHAWANAIIAKIPAAIEVASSRGEVRIELGEFRLDELGRDHHGEYFPNADDLTGGARILYDYCVREGLHLFIGGDFKMSGRWNPPFEIFIHLRR